MSILDQFMNMPAGFNQFENTALLKLQRIQWKFLRGDRMLQINSKKFIVDSSENSTLIITK